jgi:hypothetical protein
MIEKFPRKRMVIGISVLVLLTVIVLIIESKWTEPGKKKFLIENNSTCWLRESFEIIKECHPCSDFEIAHGFEKAQGVCIHTHNKEMLKCKSGETVSRSCDKVAWLDEKNFWSFQGITFTIGFLAYLVAYSRQKVLNRRAILKIQRQLRNP